MKYKPEIKEIRKKSLWNKKQKNLSISKTKEIAQNLLELERNLFKPKKYYHYDDIEYKGIRDVENLFNLSTDEDYYKLIRTNGACG